MDSSEGRGLQPDLILVILRKKCEEISQTLTKLSDAALARKFYYFHLCRTRNICPQLLYSYMFFAHAYV